VLSCKAEASFTHSKRFAKTAAFAIIDTFKAFGASKDVAQISNVSNLRYEMTEHHSNFGFPSDFGIRRSDLCFMGSLHSKFPPAASRKSGAEFVH